MMPDRHDQHAQPLRKILADEQIGAGAHEAPLHAPALDAARRRILISCPQCGHASAAVDGVEMLHGTPLGTPGHAKVDVHLLQL